MKRFLLIVALSSCALMSAHAQEYEWKHVEMDGSRTGCTSPSKDNVPQAVGTIKRGVYTAPNGKVYRNASAGRPMATGFG